MIRLARVERVRAKFFKNFASQMEVKMGLDRILFMSILFFLMIHIIACFWIFIA